MTDLKIPVGISDFAKIQNYGYYYVDKTGLISDLLEKETADTMKEIEEICKEAEIELKV